MSGEICVECKRIWHPNSKFSSSLCPECHRAKVRPKIEMFMDRSPEFLEGYVRGRLSAAVDENDKLVIRALGQILDQMRVNAVYR